MYGYGLHLRGCFLYCNECLKVVMAVNMVKVKVKIKFSLEQAMKAQRGSRGIALLFL
jgi:hypothetical protein